MHEYLEFTVQSAATQPNHEREATRAKLPRHAEQGKGNGESTTVTRTCLRSSASLSLASISSTLDGAPPPREEEELAGGGHGGGFGGWGRGVSC